MSIELMLDQKSIMPIEDFVPTWMLLDCKNVITIERLLKLQIQKLERLPKDEGIALKKLKATK